jgi:putative acetyltransferase
VTFALRPARLADAEMIAALLRDAFGGVEEARLVAALRAEGAVVAELVAETADGIAGHILFSAAPIGAASAVALAPLAVARPARRQGLGAALVRDGLARCAAAGVTAAHVLGDPDYDARFGFQPARGMAGAPWCDHPAFQVMALGPCPAPCGAVRYARAFGVFGAG